MIAMGLMPKARQNVIDALFEIAPGAQWAFKGEDISTGLQWLDATIPCPSTEDILAKAAEIDARPPPPKRPTPVALLAQLTSKEYDALKAAVVAAGVLTAERADALFAPQ